MIYLATPYSHPSQEVQSMRFRAACVAAGNLIRKGEVVFSPIAATHPIKKLVGLEGSWEQWQYYDTEIISRCVALYVLQIEGWKESKGVRAEIETAKGLGIRVEHIRPEDVGLYYTYPYLKTLAEMQDLI